MPHAKSNFSKAKDSKGTIRQLLVDLKDYKKSIILAMIFAILSSGLGVVGPKLLGEITTIAVDSFTETGAVDWLPITKIADILIVIYLLSSLLSYFQSLLMNIMTAHYTKNLRERILKKINHLPVSYFDKHQNGDILSRMSNDIDTIAGGLSEEIIEIVTSVITIIGILIMMLTISLPLSAISLVSIPLSVVFIKNITKKAQKLFVASRETLGILNNHIEEDYSAQLIIKSFSHEEKSTEHFEKVNKKLYEESWKSNFLSRLSFPIVHILTNLSYVAVCVFGGFLAIDGKITIGNIQAFIQYTSQFNRPVSNIADIIGNIQLTIAAAERIFEFLSEKEEPKDSENPKHLENPKGHVVFHDICFAYEKDTPIIKNFSIDIPAGSQVAIVGPTGAGKTTIINLLMRFYDVDSGYISIDDVPVSEMTRKEVRSLFGMVLQDTWLFSGTIAENLKYGDTAATDEKMYTATKNANVDHYIESLDKSYDTMISEDSDNISAGQKQLLTIARAIIANPPMIILDEATSNVDTRTEQLIQEAFDRLTKNRTSFIIAHRLSTIRNADIILVMDKGKIVEKGNHEELLKKNGFYAELYNSQLSEN